MSETHQPRIPKGRYRARAVTWGLGTAATRREQVAVEFELTDDEWRGQRITWYGFFGNDPGRGTKTPTQITVEALRACGWQGDDISELDGLDANEVELVIEPETFRGETRSKVKYVNRPSGLGLRAPMTHDQARAFAARMKGDVIQASRRIQPATNAPPTRRSGGDEDAPF